MRFRNTFMLVGLLVTCLVGLAFFGCSDDDNTTTGVYSGDTYQIVRAQVNDILQQSSGQFAAALDASDVQFDDVDSTEAQLDTLRGILFGPAPIDSSGADSNLWWAFFYSDLAASASVNRVDSLRWLNGDQPVQNPTQATSMDFHRHYSVVNADTTSSYEDVTFATNLHIAGLTSDTATVTGSLEFDIVSKDVEADGTVRQIYDVQVDITSLTVGKLTSGWDTGCPSGGTASVTVAHSYKDGVGSYRQMSWTFDVTFDDGSITADVSNAQGLSAEYGADICSVQ